MILKIEELLKHDDVLNVWPRLVSIAKSDSGFIRDFLLFAVGLPNDWDHRAPVPREELSKHVADAMDACWIAADQIERYAAEIAAANGQPVSGISLIENPRRAYSLPAGSDAAYKKELLALRGLLVGDDMANLGEALPQLTSLLRNLVKMTRLSGQPISLAVMPTKIRGKKTGPVVFFIRSLSWFILDRVGKPDDLLVAAFASAISGKTVDEGRVRKRRVELEEHRKRQLLGPPH